MKREGREGKEGISVEKGRCGGEGAMRE